MHHFESNGFQFNYNSDYSGEIHITDDRGHEFTREFHELVNVAADPSGGRSQPNVKAVRDFVAQAVRMATICWAEQASTDELLLSRDAFEIYGIVKNNL